MIQRGHYQILTSTQNYDSTETDIVVNSSNPNIALAPIVTTDDVKKVQVFGVEFCSAYITIASTNETCHSPICMIIVASHYDLNLLKLISVRNLYPKWRDVEKASRS